jgi:hypothetical protein
LRVNITPSGATITSIALSALSIALPFLPLLPAHTISKKLHGVRFAFRLTICRAKRASVISQLAFSEPILDRVDPSLPRGLSLDSFYWPETV